jgi:lipopolysaccharide transport system permease protein
MKEGITIYEPNYRHKLGFFKIWIVLIKNIINSKDLIYQLFKRDFLAVYKKSFLGVSWIFIAPLIGIISWVFMNATGILQPGDVGIPYPAYVLLSTSIWGLFMGFFTSSSLTLAAGSSFIMQVNYPHEVLLVKQTAEHLSNFLLGFVLILIVLILFGVMPDWKIIFFPLMMIPLFLFGASIGLIVALTSAAAQDISKVVQTLLGLAMYITPVIYSPKLDHPLLQNIIKWNPLTYLVGGVRDIIIYGKTDSVEGYVCSSVLALFMFLFSWRLFYLAEDRIIEKMI